MVYRLLLTGLVTGGICLTSFYNFLLFHSVVEVFSILVAFGVFVISWNTRRYITYSGKILAKTLYLKGFQAIFSLCSLRKNIFKIIKMAHIITKRA
jgi:hypothetical protein